MFGQHSRSILRYNRQLSQSCEEKLGVSVAVFKLAKQLVNLAALVLAGYAINAGAEPFISMAFAAIIITGPEAIEYWLVSEYGPGDSDD